MCVLTPPHRTAPTGLYNWGGKLRRVPEDFDVPCVTLRLAFQLWHLGDPKSTYPPLCQVETVDVGDDSGGPKQVTKRRRFANFRTLMRKFDKVSEKKSSVTALITIIGTPDRLGSADDSQRQLRL